MIDLHAKIGPLPIWAWGGIVGVAGVGFMYWRSSKSASSSAATATDGTTDTTDATGADTDAIDGAFGTGSTTSSDGTTADDTGSSLDVSSSYGTGTSAFDSNATWLAQGVAYLVGLGIASPLEAQNVLSDYLGLGTRTTLSAKEAALLNQVIAKQGVPPEGSANISVNPAPATPAPVTPAPTGTHAGGTVTPKVSAPAKATTASYTVPAGATLSGIAQKFYGHSTTAYVDKIAKANHITNPNEIKAGQKLVIPK